MIFNNPELKKNLKLEFNLFRFVIPLVLLFLMIWLGWSMADEPRGWSNVNTFEQLQYKSIFSWLCGFGFFFTIVWGTYLVTNSLIDEIKVKTWDFVRMSSLSPMKSLIGKMFGTTSVIWTITILCVLPWMLYAGSIMIPKDGVIRPESLTLTVLALCILAWVILSYSLTTMMTFSVTNSQDRAGAFGATFLVFILGTTVGQMIVGGFNQFHSMRWYGKAPKGDIREAPNHALIVNDHSYMQNPHTSSWYDVELYTLDMIAFVLVFFAFWAFIGAWRLLRKSLQYHDTPWVWLIFIVSACVFMGGFKFGGIGRFVFSDALLIWPIFVGWLSMFFACISEAGDVIKYRSFKKKLSDRLYLKAFRETPLWMISFVIFLLCVTANLFIIGVNDIGKILLLTSIIGLTIRDLLFIHAIFWMPNLRRPLIGLIVYIVMIYMLFPAIAGTIDKDYSGLFVPLDKPDMAATYWGLLFPQILLGAYLVKRYWKKSVVMTDDIELAMPQT